MANTFKSIGASAIGTTLVSVYTAPASTTTTVIGCSVANTNATMLVNVDVTLTKSGVDYYLIKNAPIAPGSTLVVVGGDQKLVVQTGNVIKVRSSLASSVDAIISILETI